MDKGTALRTCPLVHRLYYGYDDDATPPNGARTWGWRDHFTLSRIRLHGTIPTDIVENPRPWC